MQAIIIVESTRLRARAWASAEVSSGSLAFSLTRLTESASPAASLFLNELAGFAWPG